MRSALGHNHACVTTLSKGPSEGKIVLLTGFRDRAVEAVDLRWQCAVP